MRSRKYLPLVVPLTMCTIYLTVFFTSFTIQTTNKESPQDVTEPGEERFLIGHKAAYVGVFFFAKQSTTPVPYDRISIVAVEQSGRNNENENENVMLSKPPEPAADVANVSSAHEERPHLGPNNETVVTQSKPPVPAEERPDADSNTVIGNTKAVTRPNAQESGASAQFSNTRDDKKMQVPLTHDKLLLFPPEPKPVAMPPTVVNYILVKNGNRHILKLPLDSSQTNREVDQDVLSSTDKRRDMTKFDRVAAETNAPRVSNQLALKTNNLVSHNKHFTNLGQETKVYDKVDHRKGDVKGFTTRGPSIDTVKQSPRQFHDTKAAGRSYKTRQIQMTRSVFDKSVTKRGFRKAYASPNFTRPGMSSIQRYSDMKRLLKQPTSISNKSIVNTTAMLVLEPMTGERPIVKLSDFLMRKTHPNESTTHKNINASRSKTPTTLNSPTVKQRVFEQSRIIPVLRPPEIPTTTINSTVQERAFEKYNNVPFLRQPEIPTTPVSPSGQKRVSEEFNIPFFSPPEIPITLNRPTVQQKTFEKLNKTPFIEPLEISTTPNSPTVKQTSFENSTKIPLLDPPEITRRRESLCNKGPLKNPIRSHSGSHHNSQQQNTVKL